METAFYHFFYRNDELIKTTHFDGRFIARGNSIYEVIRVIEGIPIFFERHADRLINSARLTGNSLPLNIQELKVTIYDLIKVNNVNTGNIKIIFNYYGNQDKMACTYYTYFIKHNYPSENDYKNGIDTILFHGERHNPAIKVANVDFREAINQEIERQQVFEAILVDKDGNITEGSKSNIFLVSGKSVYTAPLDKVLAGITREYVLSVCRHNSIKVVEECININNLAQIDALFISGTSPKILPINKVDKTIFNSGSNQIVQKIMAGYDQILDDYITNAK